MNTAELTEGQKATVQNYISQMEKMLVNDFYIRQEGDRIYVICQTYSADQAAEAAAFLDCLQPTAGSRAGSIPKTEAGSIVLQTEALQRTAGSRMSLD